MSYNKIENVLPQDLIEKLQNYVQGELIYIPKKVKNRGACPVRTRNNQIIADHKMGWDKKGLAYKYKLSLQTIYRILQTCS